MVLQRVMQTPMKIVTDILQKIKVLLPESLAFIQMLQQLYHIKIKSHLI